MSRNIYPANLAAAQADSGSVRIWFVELDFSSGPVYACTAPQSITVGGITYAGIGSLGQIADIEEGVDNQSYTSTVQLSGVDPAMIGIAVNQRYQGRQGKILLGWADQDYNLLAPPDVIFAGTMDVMTIEVDATASIQLSINDPRSDWERPRSRRWTDADQQAAWAGDLGFAFVQGLQDQVIYWGPQSTSSS